MDLEELVQICGERHKVISIVGAGGKTGLMYELARQCSKRGQRVLVSTTTHIAEPENHLAVEEEEVLRLWKEGTYAVTGKKASGKSSLCRLTGSLIRSLKKRISCFWKRTVQKVCRVKYPRSMNQSFFQRPAW